MLIYPETVSNISPIPDLTQLDAEGEPEDNVAQSTVPPPVAATPNEPADILELPIDAIASATSPDATQFQWSPISDWSHPLQFDGVLQDSALASWPASARHDWTVTHSANPSPQYHDIEFTEATKYPDQPSHLQQDLTLYNQDPSNINEILPSLVRQPSLLYPTFVGDKLPSDAEWMPQSLFDRVNECVSYCLFPL
jgi:hypothetical protein